MALKEPEPKKYTRGKKKKNRKKEILFKRRHINFQPKATISLRLAGVRTKCSRKNGEKEIPCSDKTFLFRKVDGGTNQSRDEYLTY